MPKTTKTSKKRLKVKGLQKAEKELTADEAKGVKGGFVIYGRNDASRLTDVTDGTSNTLLVGEKHTR